MLRTIRNLLRRHGTRMTLHTAGGAVEFRGFLHSRGKQNGKRELTVLGEVPGGGYLLILPPDLPCRPGDRVTQGLRRFELRQVEPVLYGDSTLYQWGLCVEEGA